MIDSWKTNFKIQEIHKMFWARSTTSNMIDCSRSYIGTKTASAAGHRQLWNCQWDSHAHVETIMENVILKKIEIETNEAPNYSIWTTLVRSFQEQDHLPRGTLVELFMFKDREVSMLSLLYASMEGCTPSLNPRNVSCSRLKLQSKIMVTYQQMIRSVAH